MLCIIDYDMGNLRSVQKGFERVGHEAVISSDPAEVAAADKLVLPGVGAFRDAIAALGERGLVEPILQAVAAEKPLLGICLGMQLLFEVSHEDGEHRGLGLLPGSVERFALPREYKVPHMGWNQVRHPGATPPLFAGVEPGSYFYFVHTYYVRPTESADIAAEADYGGAFCASVARGRVMATQFHPEKSQAAGLRLLQNFAELA